MNEVELNLDTKFESLPPSEQKNQIAIWALTFLIAEVALSVRALRIRLTERGALKEEDEELINQACSDLDSLTQAYGQLDRAFHEKCQRFFYAMTHPEEIAKRVTEEVNPNEPSPLQPNLQPPLRYDRRDPETNSEQENPPPRPADGQE